MICQSCSTKLDPLRGKGNGRPMSVPVRVHSVFRRACNLTVLQHDNPMEELIPEGLVTVAAAELGNLPNGIVIPLAPEADLRKVVDAGQQGRFGEGVLRMPSITIDLKGAARWDPDLAALRKESWEAGWHDRWALVRRVLEEERPPGSLGSVTRDGAQEGLLGSLEKRAREGIEQILEGCARLDGSMAARGAEALVGLGLGLTPSGDDLLVGLLAGLWCRPASDRRQTFLRDFLPAVVAASRRTTDVSRAYLKWAAQGCVAQRLYDLAGAIIRPCPPDRVAHLVRQVVHLARQALAVGSTSGADGVYGLLLGLSVWEDAGDTT